MKPGTCIVALLPVTRNLLPVTVLNRFFLYLGRGQNGSHLEDRNHRKEPYKQEQQHKEKANRSKQHREIPDCRLVVAPGRRKEILMKALHDYDESFEPHTNADDNGRNKDHRDAVPKTLEPKELRRQAVTEDQQPIEERIVAGHPVPNYEPLVFVRAVPAEERLHQIAIKDDQPGSKHNLRHESDVFHG